MFICFIFRVPDSDAPTTPVLVTSPETADTECAEGSKKHQCMCTVIKRVNNIVQLKSQI